MQLSRLLGLALLLVAAGTSLHGLGTTAMADEHFLVVTQYDGNDVLYRVDTIARIRFDNGEMLLLLHDLPGEQGFVLDTLASLTFLRAAAEETLAETPAAPTIAPTQLDQSFPNPFRLATRIDYRPKTAGHVELAIYDVTGRRVRALVSDGRTADTHTVLWDGTDDAGRRVASGTYFCRLQAPGVDETRRILHLE
jgi:hypothetical protein